MPFSPSDHLSLNKPIATSGKPEIARYCYYDQNLFLYRQFLSLAEVIAYYPTTTSRKYLNSALVNTGGTISNGVITGGTNDEYWWKDNYTDAGLVLKNQSAGIAPDVTKAYVDNLVAGINAQITSTNTNVTNLQNTVGGIQTSISTLNTEVSTLQADITALSAQTLNTIANNGNSTNTTLIAASAIQDVELTTLGQVKGLILDGSGDIDLSQYVKNTFEIVTDTDGNLEV